MGGLKSELSITAEFQRILGRKCSKEGFGKGLGSIFRKIIVENYEEK